MNTPRADLGQVVAAAARWSLMSSVVQRVAQVGVGIVVARLVAPADMGVYAAALVAVALVVGISELGVAVGVVRTARPIHQVAPTAVTIAVVWCLSITVALMAVAPQIARALGAPAASGPLRLMAVAVVIGGISAVPAALAQRSFRHRRRAVAELVGFGVGATLTVVMAAAGAGAWSLAAGRVSTNLIAAAVLMASPSLRHRPGWHADSARELFGIGLPLTGAGLVALALWQVDSVIIGRHLGAASLGWYVLAFNLASWPVTALSVAARAVTLPAFAELRSDPARCAAAFPVALRTVLSAAIPAVVLLTITGPALVRVVYGSRWSAAGEVVAVLAWLGALRVIVDVAVDFLAAAGRSVAILWTHAVWLGALVPALLVGSRVNGLVGVATAHVAIASIVAIPILLWAVAALGVSVGAVASAVRRPLAAGVVAGTVGFTATRPLPDDLAVLAVGSFAVAAGSAAVLWPIRPWRTTPALTLAATEVHTWP